MFYLHFLLLPLLLDNIHCSCTLIKLPHLATLFFTNIPMVYVPVLNVFMQLVWVPGVNRLLMR